MQYVYSVITYVPNPASGESVNVGAIAGRDDAGDWEIRQADDLKRARAFGPPARLDATFTFINEIGRRIDDTESIFGQDVSESWLNDLRYRHATSSC